MACLLRQLTVIAKMNNCAKLAMNHSVRDLTLSALRCYSVKCRASPVKTVGYIENKLIETFEDKNVSDANESANFIIAHALGHKTLSSVSRYRELKEFELENIDKMSEERLKHVPVQYVLKEWDFVDITLKMKPPVFIPRPETEELIEHMHTDPVVSSARHFVEIGPGSGAISLSLLHRYPTLHCTAFEAGTEASDLTRTNAVSLDLSSRLTLHQIPLEQNTMYDIMELLRDSPVDFIVSNPPYILTKDMQVLQKEIALYEDTLALDGGPDGMNVIYSILDLAQNVIKPTGSVWLETDSSHPNIIQNIADSYELQYCKTIKDFRKHDRFCHLIRK